MCIYCTTAALHSQLGSKADRLNEQDIKEACTHFQCAAGVLVYLYVRWWALVGVCIICYRFKGQFWSQLLQGHGPRTS